MASLQWSEEWVLGDPVMDHTHEEFVQLLGTVEEAADAALLPAWERLIEHTDEHFAREDGWMRQTGFAASNCHSGQHEMVLAVMREGGKRGAAGDLALVRQLARELAVWFPQHAHSMDAALAMHMTACGFDSATGAIAAPHKLPAQAIHGCGGASCSGDDEAAPQEAAPTDASPATA